MKKNVAVQYVIDPDRRYRLAIRSLEHLQDAPRYMMEKIMQELIPAYSAPTRMFGVENTISGADHAVSEGAIYWELSASAWSSATAYLTGQTVSKSGKVYAALQGGTGLDPETNPAYWIYLGNTGDGQIFSVDAVTLVALANVKVARFVTTFIAGDPAIFADTTTANVHAIVKLTFVDALTGTGAFDFSAIEWNDRWLSYTPALSADDGASPVASGFTGTASGKYLFKNNILHIKMSVTAVAILATVKNLLFSLPATQLNTTSLPISPYNMEGFNMAKRGDISNSSYTAQQVSIGIRHTGAGLGLAVSKLDATAFAASANGTVEFYIAINYRRDGD